MRGRRDPLLVFNSFCFLFSFKFLECIIVNTCKRIIISRSIIMSLLTRWSWSFIWPSLFFSNYMPRALVINFSLDDGNNYRFSQTMISTYRLSDLFLPVVSWCPFLVCSLRLSFIISGKNPCISFTRWLGKFGPLSYWRVLLDFSVLFTIRFIRNERQMKMNMKFSYFYLFYISAGHVHFIWIK